MLDLEPKKVFKYFEEINQIPRGSGNEERISSFLVQFALDRNLKVFQDKNGSVLITKPASKGLEDASGIIIQGHMDMVCVKTKDSKHNFLTDPISHKIEGDFLRAVDTTLGADNGIAVAMALALLDDKELVSPKLEVLITTDEEVGMSGALEFDTSKLTGKYLINIDSESEGEIIVGCAGGIKSKLFLEYTLEKIDKDYIIKEIVINGLKGGHSGIEISEKKANSHKLMGRLLSTLGRHMDFDISMLYGGTRENVIPSETTCVIALSKNNEKLLENLAQELQETLRDEYYKTDPNISINIKTLHKEAEKTYYKVDKHSKNNIILVLNTLPNGVISMNQELENMVESSLSLGVIRMEEGILTFSFEIRSNKASLKEYIVSVIEDFSKLASLKFMKNDGYPEWEMKLGGKLLEVASKTYTELRGQKPAINSIHAGLECGVFLSKRKDIEAISIGPNIYAAHSTEESLSISSTKRTWEYLLKLIENLAKL